MWKKIKPVHTRPGMQILVLAACIGLFFSFSNQAYATHAAGADLTYKCLGGLVYEIEATFYRDCGGSAEPSSVTINYKSTSCNYSRNVIATKVLTGNGVEITLPCAASPSSCNGGMSTGIRKWVYRGVVTLPYACSDWVFSYHVCCRNCSVTTIQSPCATGSEIYVEATLNNVAAPGNSSPVFNNVPVSFVCLGQNSNYNQGVYDADGDSISYELILPKTSSTSNVTWIPPVTTESPLSSSTPFILNPITGDINFTPSAMQIGILALRVNEFRNGQQIGSTIRDMQLYTRICSNSNPVASGINGTSAYTTQSCAGQNICFNINAIDADSNQALTFTTSNHIQGSVITQNSGAQPSLQFCWTPTVADISEHPHIFTVTVRDDACPENGIQTFSYAIYVNPKPVISVVGTDPLCFGLNNGTASVAVVGTGSHTFEWNTTPVQTGAVANGLSPGNYTVTVTDSVGCSATGAVTIGPSPAALQADAVATGIITCQSGNIGEVQVAVQGGQTPYSYLWNTGSISPTLMNLPAATYIVTVTDDNGCIFVDSAVVQSVPGSLNAVPLVTHHVSCFGGNDGSASVTASGGSEPYQYLWSNGSTASQVSGISAGNYQVTVTDSGGCSSSLTVAVIQPNSPLLANGVCSNVSCFGNLTGSIDLQTRGGTSPYTYEWMSGSTNEDLSGIGAGQYQVTITDAQNCSVVQNFVISQPDSAVSGNVIVDQHVTCYGGENGQIHIAPSGGLAPYAFLWNNGASSPQLSNLEVGIYIVSITDANHCVAIVQGSITQPSTPVSVLATVIDHVSCYGGSNGQIDLNVNGGTIPYSFLWSNGSNAEDLSNLASGLYSCSIADSKGCTVSAAAEIIQPSQPLNASLNTIMPSCSVEGQISVLTSGGNSPYQFLWSNGSVSNQVTGLIAGSYSVTVTDANGCSINLDQQIIASPSTLSGTISVEQTILCYGNSTGLLRIVGSSRVDLQACKLEYSIVSPK